MRLWDSLFLRNFTIALACVATGYACLLMAPQPGVVSPFWAPSGIALSAILLGGRRVLPGVVTGMATITVFAFGRMGAGWQSVAGVVAAVLAASGLQLLLEVQIIRRNAGRDLDLTSERSLMLLLLAAGPIGGLLSAVISVPAMAATGTLAHGFFPTFALWWMGGAVGTAVVAPLVLVWAQAIRNGRLVSAVVHSVIMGAALLGVIVAHAVGVGIEDSRRDMEINAHRHEVTHVFEERLILTSLAIESVAGVFEASSEVQTAEFGRFASRFVASSEVFSWVAWVPTAPGAPRFELVETSLNDWPVPGAELRPGGRALVEQTGMQSGPALRAKLDDGRILLARRVEHAVGDTRPAGVVLAAVSLDDLVGTAQGTNQGLFMVEVSDKPGAVPLPVADMTLYVQTTPTAQLRHRVSNLGAWHLVGAGMMLAALMQAFLIVAMGHRLHARDAESRLREANDHLSRVLDHHSKVEHHAQVAELRMRALVESTDDAVITVDLHGRVTSWNSAASRMFGHSAAQANGQLLETLWSASDGPASERQLPSELRDSRLQSREVVRFDSKGTPVPVSLTVSPLPDESGQVIGASYIARDIRENLKMRRTLDEQAERLQRQNEVLRDLSRVQSIINGDLEGAMLAITEAAARVISVDRASVWLTNANGDHLVCRDQYETGTHTHSGGATVPLASCVPYFVALQRDDIIDAEDARNDPRTLSLREEYLEHYGIGAMLDAPIRIEGRVIGVLCHEHIGGPRHWHPEDAAFARSLAALVSLALEAGEKRAAREALKASEQRLRDIVESATVPMVITRRRDGVIRFANQRAAELFGVDRADLNGAPIAQYFADPTQREAFAQSVESDQFVADHEMQFRRADGDLLWALVSARTMTLDGETAIIGSIYDITQRRAVEQALRASEKRLAHIASVTPGALYQYELRPDGTHHFSYVSDGIRDLLGIEPGLMISDSAKAWARVVPEQIPALQQAVIESATNMTPFREEFQARHDSGEVRWVHALASPEKLEDGTVLWTGIYLDVTSRRTAEDALRSNEALLRHTGRMARVGGWRLFAEGATVTLTEEAARIHDMPASAPSLVPLEHLLSWCVPEFRSRLDRAIDNAVRGNGEIDVEYPIEIRGRRRWLRIVAQQDPASSTRQLVGAIQDVTERMETEGKLRHNAEEIRFKNQRLQEALLRAEEATRLKSEFVASMSHEIRTPLNGIIGMTSVVLGTEMTAAQRECIETIQFSGEALLHIVNDVLDYSKIEAGHMDLERAPFELRQVLEDSMEMVADRAQEKGLEITLLADHELPRTVIGDAGRLRQVFLNLLSNAVKFTTAGDVHARASLDAPGMLRLEIIDTGIGIPRAAADRIFAPFMQADASTTRRFGGTGLGLAISRRLVELMGGKIGFDSTPGQGTRFWITLPLPAAEWQGPRTTDALRRLLQGRKLLHVADHPRVAQVLTRQLEDAGLRVTTVEPAGAEASGFEAVIVSTAGALEPRLALARRLAEATEVAVLCTRRERAAVDAAGLCPIIKPARVAALLESVAAMVRHEPAPVSRRTRALNLPRIHARVLVAEDNPVNQKVARAMLDRLGCTVQIVPNGLAAVEAAASGRWDVILMDCQMPELDGYSATRRIRALEDGRSRVPILALTAGALQGDREACTAAGMDDYLTKPLELDVLADALARHAGTLSPMPRVETRDSSAEGALDITRLRDMVGEDPALIDDLVHSFVESSRDRLEALKAALAEGDSNAVRHAAHSIKGASANFGARKLQELAARIERQAKEGVLDDGPTLLAGMQGAFTEIHDFVRTRRVPRKGHEST